MSLKTVNTALTTAGVLFILYFGVSFVLTPQAGPHRGRLTGDRPGRRGAIRPATRWPAAVVARQR